MSFPPNSRSVVGDFFSSFNPAFPNRFPSHFLEAFDVMMGMVGKNHITGSEGELQRLQR